MTAICCYLTTVFSLMIAAAGGLAAWFWYWSSKVPYPDNLRSITPIGGPGTVFTEPLLKAVRENGRLNKWAAGWSAVAALLVMFSALSSGSSGPMVDDVAKAMFL